MTGHAGNIAHTLRIDNQTINYGGKPEWIQTLATPTLVAVGKRLQRASRWHEDRAVLPLLAPIVVALLLGAVFSILLRDVPMAARHQFGPAMLTAMALVALPVWFALYDIRRRHRKAVIAAEQRWAEIVVEIATREDAPPYQSPIKRLARWWHKRHDLPE